MADEIDLTVRGVLKHTSGTKLEDLFAVSNVRLTQTNAKAFADTLALTTSEQTLDLSSMTQPGYIFMRNMDTSNTIEFGGDSSGLVKCGEIPPQGFAVFQVGSSATLKAKTAAGTASLYFKLWDQ